MEKYLNEEDKLISYIKNNNDKDIDIVNYIRFNTPNLIVDIDSAYELLKQIHSKFKTKDLNGVAKLEEHLNSVVRVLFE